MRSVQGSRTEGAGWEGRSRAQGLRSWPSQEQVIRAEWPGDKQDTWGGAIVVPGEVSAWYLVVTAWHPGQRAVNGAKALPLGHSLLALCSQRWWQEGLETTTPVLGWSSAGPSSVSGLPWLASAHSGSCAVPARPEGRWHSGGCDFRSPEQCLSGINSYHPFLMLLNPE